MPLLALIPESQLEPIPKSEAIVNQPQFVLDHLLRNAQHSCHFTVVEPLRNQFYQQALALVPRERLMHTVVVQWLRQEQVREFNPLDSANNPEAKIDPGEVSLYGSRSD